MKTSIHNRSAPSRTTLASTLALCFVIFGMGPPDAQATHRFGGGVNYWTALRNIDVRDVDSDGFSYLLSYQYKPSLFGFGADFEFLPDRFGSDAYAPQAYVLFGSLVYAGVGAGWVYTNSSFADNPFYSLRAGLDLNLAPHLHLDLYGQYRFESRHDLQDDDRRIDTDTIFLGAAFRLVF